MKTARSDGGLSGRGPSRTPLRQMSMSIHLQLDEDQSKRLIELALQLKVDPSDLAKAAIEELVSPSSSEFDHAANRVLMKNQELYRRLS